MTVFTHLKSLIAKDRAMLLEAEPALSTTLSNSRPVASKQATYDRWLIASWLLTVARLPLAALVMGLLAMHDHFTIISSTILGIIVIDILDGKIILLSKDQSSGIARHTMDAFLDRAIIASVAWVGFMNGYLPAEMVALFLTREALLVLATVMPYVRYGIVIQAHWISKVATVLIGLTIINQVTPFIPANVLLAAFVLFSVVGLYTYVRTWSGATTEVLR